MKNFIKKLMVVGLCMINGAVFAAEKSQALTPQQSEQQNVLESQCAQLSKDEGVAPVIFLFAHGLWGNKKNAEWYAPSEKNKWHLITCPYYSFNFSDVGKTKGAVKKTRVNIGQHRDIDTLTSAYDKILRDQQKKAIKQGIVLIGSSRGAVTILNTAGTQDLPRLKAIIAEAPTDNVLNVINYNLKKYHLNWSWLVGLGDYALSKLWFTGYDPEGINPLAVVDKIDKKTPIMFIHALDDDFVSVDSSRALYYKLLESGHDDVYLLELKHGQHGKYNLGSDASKYEETVHAFYKKYGIPYTAELAKKGEQYLAKCQPSLDDIARKLGK